LFLQASPFAINSPAFASFLFYKDVSYVSRNHIDETMKIILTENTLIVHFVSFNVFFFGGKPLQWYDVGMPN
jgi:hypothetical protein